MEPIIELETDGLSYHIIVFSLFKKKRNHFFKAQPSSWGYSHPLTLRLRGHYPSVKLYVKSSLEAQPNITRKTNPLDLGEKKKKRQRKHIQITKINVF